MSNKTLRGNVSIYVAYPEGIADLDAPLLSELNNTAYVFDISCAVNDDYTLNPAASDTDDTQSVCDVGVIETPTFANYEAEIDTFRDASLTAAGVYNLALKLLKVRGIDYILIKRIGVPQGTAFAEGQIVSLFEVTTDNPVDIEDASSPMQQGARFKPRGVMNVEYELEAESS